MSVPPIALVAMRLADMNRMHPRQDDSKACSRCGARVGIYPSGQSALKHNPRMPILCQVCAMREPPEAVVARAAASSWDELAQESRDSFDVGKA
jgi:hypothetical protein